MDYSAIDNTLSIFSCNRYCRSIIIGTKQKWTEIRIFSNIRSVEPISQYHKQWGRLKSGIGWISLDYCTRIS